MIGHQIVEIIRELKYSEIRPGCEHLQKYIPSINTLKYTFIGVIFLSIIFSRPKWCSDKGVSIDFQCRQSLVPQNPTIYPSAYSPIISADIKSLICIMSMVIIDILWSFKLRIILAHAGSKFCLSVCVFITFFYTINEFLTYLQIFNIYWNDLLLTIYLIFCVSLL